MVRSELKEIGPLSIPLKYLFKTFKTFGKIDKLL